MACWNCRRREFGTDEPTMLDTQVPNSDPSTVEPEHRDDAHALAADNV